MKQVDAKNVDDDFHHREDAGLDDGNGMQQGAHRRRRYHRRRQPAVERHEGCFAGAEGEERQQNADDGVARLAGEDSTGSEIEGAGDVPSPDDGEQQKHHRRADQDPQIDTPAAHGLRCAVVGHEGIGGEGQ